MIKTLKSPPGTDLVPALPHASHTVHHVGFSGARAAGHIRGRIRKSPGRTGCGRDFGTVRRQGLEPRTR